jgi:hypothetical protein
MAGPFSIRGGIRIGRSYWVALNLSAPLARLALEPERVILALPFREIRLDRQSIQSVRPENGIFSKGVRIIHSDPLVSPFVLFWTRRAGELIAAFRQCGYSVS